MSLDEFMAMHTACAGVIERTSTLLDGSDVPLESLPGLVSDVQTLATVQRDLLKDMITFMQTQGPPQSTEKPQS